MAVNDRRILDIIKARNELPESEIYETIYAEFGRGEEVTRTVDEALSRMNRYGVITRKDGMVKYNKLL